MKREELKQQGGLNNNNKLTVKRGEIYWVDLPTIGGSIQKGIHPCLILQNDMGNKYSPNAQVCCLTSKIMKKDMPTHVNIKADVLNKLDKDSVILVETVTNIPKALIKDYIGKVGQNKMVIVDNALKIQLGLREEFDRTYVDKIVFEIKKFKEMFQKYRDDFFKELIYNTVEDLKKYCINYGKDYRRYLYNFDNRMNLAV